MEIVLIAAVAKNGVIGVQGKIPWQLPVDLKRFKQLTLGYPVIMGRKTWESLGKLLPGRMNIVLTRQELQVQDVVVRKSLRAALEDVRMGKVQQPGISLEKVYIIGGQQVYAEALLLADRLEITEVALEPKGDAFFPAIDKNVWTEEKRENQQGFAFVTYVRRK